PGDRCGWCRAPDAATRAAASRGDRGTAAVRIHPREAPRQITQHRIIQASQTSHGVVLRHALFGGEVAEHRILLSIFTTHRTNLLKVDRIRSQIYLITIYCQYYFSTFSATC